MESENDQLTFQQLSVLPLEAATSKRTPAGGKIVNRVLETIFCPNRIWDRLSKIPCGLGLLVSFELLPPSKSGARQLGQRSV
jgi:hypothetical protein